MAQINLLSEHYKRSVNQRQIWTWAVRVLAVLAALALIYYLVLFFRLGAGQKQLAKLQAQLAQKQEQIIHNADRDELIARQGQLSALANLLKNHLYWSGFFPQLARVTLKSSAYVSVSAVNDGTMNLVVSVPDYTELDKFLQVFDQPQFNKIFSDVKITSISRSQQDKALATRFQIQMKFDPSILKPDLSASSGNQ